MLAPCKKIYDKPRQHIKKQRRCFAKKVSLVKTMVFPVVMYGCESWTLKKAECWRIDAFELWYWRRLLWVPWACIIHLIPSPMSWVFASSHLTNGDKDLESLSNCHNHLGGKWQSGPVSRSLPASPPQNPPASSEICPWFTSLRKAKEPRVCPREPGVCWKQWPLSQLYLDQHNPGSLGRSHLTPLIVNS